MSKGTKTGSGRRNHAAQRMDEAFAEIRELRAYVTALLKEVNRLDAKLNALDARTPPMENIGPSPRSVPIDQTSETPIPPLPRITC